MSDSTLYNELIVRNIGYKVVCRKNSKAFSPATSSALQSITYRIDSETRQRPAEHGAFALFDNLLDATAFFTHYGDVILLVEYDPSDETDLWKKNPPSFERTRGGYYPVSNGVTERSLSSCPRGTVLAKSVYPIEVVMEK